MPDRHRPSSPPTYRAYCVGRDGRLGSVPTVIEAADDDGAIEQARQLVDGTGIELWDLARRVVVLPPKGGDDPS